MRAVRPVSALCRQSREVSLAVSRAISNPVCATAPRLSYGMHGPAARCSSPTASEYNNLASCQVSSDIGSRPNEPHLSSTLNISTPVASPENIHAKSLNMAHGNSDHMSGNTSLALAPANNILSAKSTTIRVPKSISRQAYRRFVGKTQYFFYGRIGKSTVLAEDIMQYANLVRSPNPDRRIKTL